VPPFPAENVVARGGPDGEPAAVAAPAPGAATAAAVAPPVDDGEPDGAPEIDSGDGAESVEEPQAEPSPLGAGARSERGPAAGSDRQRKRRQQRRRRKHGRNR
jgi:hypothetical protein